MPGPLKAKVTSEELGEALARSPLFGSLQPEQLTALARASKVRTLGRGETLWRAGQKAEALGLVIGGRLALARSGDERDSVFDIAVEGELVGDVGFTLSSVYSSTVFCPRRARVALFPAEVVRRVLEENPRFTAALAVELATRVSRLLVRLETLTALSVDRRLARTLLELADQLGQPFPGGVLLPVRLRRADLASLAATTVETTSRKLTAWSKAAILRKQPAGLVIRDLTALRKLARGVSAD